MRAYSQQISEELGIKADRRRFSQRAKPISNWTGHLGPAAAREGSSIQSIEQELTLERNPIMRVRSYEACPTRTACSCSVPQLTGLSKMISSGNLRAKLEDRFDRGV